MNIMKTSQEYDQLCAFIAYSRKFVSIDQEFEQMPNDIPVGMENMIEAGNACILYGIDAL